MRPSLAGSSSQSRGSVCVRQRAGFLAGSISAAVGFLASVPGSGVPVVSAFVAVEVLLAILASCVGETVPFPHSVEVRATAVLAVADRAQSWRRSSSSESPFGAPAFIPFGAPAFIPGAGAAGPAVRVPIVPPMSGLWMFVPVEVSAVSSGFPGFGVVLASGATVVMAAVLFLSQSVRVRAADIERTRFWSLMG